MSNDFEVRIKTSADLKAAQDLKRALEEQIAATKKLGGDTSSLESQLAKVNTALSSTSGISTATSGSLAAIGTAVTVLTAALGAAKKAVEEFAQAELATAELDAALAQTGQLTDEYRERLQALAGQLQSTTGIADEQWLGVLRRLTQFGSTAETIERDVEAVKNLAGILGGDLNQAATLVARALQGNFEMFSRYGIEVEKTGTQTEQLTKLFQQLAERGGGQLEIRTKTLIGQFEALKNAASDLMEALGGATGATDVLKNVMQIGTLAASAWAEKIGAAIPRVSGLTNALRATTQQIEHSSASGDKLDKVFQQISERASNLAQNVTKATNALRQNQRLQVEIEDRNKALEIARIDEAESKGALSPAAAIQARLNVEEESARRKTEIEETVAREEINIKKAALEKLEREAKGLAAAEARIRSELARTRPLERQQEKTTQLEAQMHQARERLVLAQETIEVNPYSGKAKAAREQLPQLELTVRQLTTLLEKERARTQEVRVTTDQLQRQLRLIQEIRAKTETSQRAIRDELRASIDTIATQTPARRQIAALESQTRQTQAAAQINRLNPSQRSAPAAVTTQVNITSLEQAEAENQKVLDSLVAFMREVVAGRARITQSHFQQLIQEIGQLRARDAQLESMIANLRTR